MGETGCGKTRLIKFMCDLWKKPDVEEFDVEESDVKKPDVDVNNMILMKVSSSLMIRTIQFLSYCIIFGLC